MKIRTKKEAHGNLTGCLFLGGKDQSGFTLIELLVVIIIIAILAAIAIPMYLSQRQKARDANVKSDLYSAAVAEFTYYVEGATYSGSMDDLKARGYNQSAVKVNLSPDTPAS